MAAQPRWTKSPAELINRFHAALPKDPAVEPRKMFGFDCAFVNGNMFTGLHQADWMLRLPEADREALLAVPGARPFEPVQGRPMREYVVVPASMHADSRALARWMAKALRYGASLPAKVKTAPKSKSALRETAATKPPRRRRPR